ncbi:MAG: hypothetical protein HN509_06455 [Halobacteriovoraceae bacterium]|nr:hypothetical protein [Halobacteriovoraceae bacterium]MBT5094939.1 hypothetical protein [Halobacteriovoraceae bacterium]
MITLYRNINNHAEGTGTIAAKGEPIRREILGNTNQEFFQETHLGAAFPLPFYKIGTSKVLSSFFLHQNTGAEVTLAVPSGTTTPFVTAYVKKDLKAGLHNKIKIANNNLIYFNLYYLNRGDSLTVRNPNQIAGRQVLFTSQDITETDSFFMTDISYKLKKENFTLLAEAQEIKIAALSSPGDRSLYGTPKLFHFRAGYAWEIEDINLQLFSGGHKRTRYSISDSIYAGVRTQFVPNRFEVSLIYNQRFLELMPKFSFPWFSLIYNWKHPIVAKEDGLEVNSNHRLSLFIPFP